MIKKWANFDLTSNLISLPFVFKIIKFQKIIILFTYAHDSHYFLRDDQISCLIVKVKSQRFSSAKDK